MIGIVLHPLVLMFIMWIVARHTAEFHYVTAILVVFGVSVVSGALGFIHPLVGLVGFLLALPLALVRYCYLGLKQAAVVTGIFFAWLILYTFAVHAMLR